MHIRTRQTPMRNEGEREGEREGGRRERRWGNTVRERKRITEKGERESKHGESLFLLNSLTVVLSALPPALPQCRAAACINNAGDSTRGTGQTSNCHLPGNHHYGHHRHDNKGVAGIPTPTPSLPCWPSSPPAGVTQRGPLCPLLLDQKKAKSTARLQHGMRREKADWSRFRGWTEYWQETQSELRLAALFNISRGGQRVRDAPEEEIPKGVTAAGSVRPTEQCCLRGRHKPEITALVQTVKALDEK